MAGEMVASSTLFLSEVATALSFPLPLWERAG